ncbi:MAG: tripartite tricarboxylate transporter TctB family protein [Deltaproteobacteria bacterium]|nr:tripartite tricarboxylate transporter TctB family protein [Deltaproteobacteria bacterium]
MNKERAGGLIFFFAGIYGLIFSIQLPLGEWNQPGPAAFPLCISILLCISGTLRFIQDKGKREIDWRGLVKKLATPLQIVVLTGSFILALDWLGYLATSSLYLFFLFLWVSHYRLWTAVALAIILGAGSSYFFGKVLAVQFPTGLWVL